MHTVSQLGTGVPAFLAKLWKLVEDPDTDHLIGWSASGKSFFIRNQAQFAKELLPHYYKHNNMPSFVRQLNMYGFHKKMSVELGGLKCDKDEMVFAHQFFCKGHPYLVEHIKRKISNKAQESGHSPIKPEVMNKVLSEIKNMKGRQEHVDSKLGAMKHENEALWRELAMLRQKHIKQQQIVNKLIHFLITLVQPSRGGGLTVKRRYPLMIDDSNRQRKERKLSKSQASPTGPVIHELDASESDLDSEYIVAEMLENENPAVQSPEHSEIPMEDDLETIRLIENPVQLQDNMRMVAPHDDININRKHIPKNKKKRKNKLPVKILIPSLENEGKSRNKLHVLEMPNKAPITLTLSNNKSGTSKPVPVQTTAYNSKLVTSATNAKSNKYHDINIETSADLDDDILDNDTSNLMKLEDILIVPEIINENNIQDIENKGNCKNEADQINTRLIPVDSEKNVLAMNSDKEYNISRTSELPQKKKDNLNTASTSSSKDLSLSCVNAPESNYREEMDNHVETMETELENLREMLCGEGCSLDANTLLGLFGIDDSMTFGLPINPELNPHFEEEDDNYTNSINRFAGGELMAYNPTSNPLEFDDDMLLGNASSSLVLPTSTELIDTSDTLNLEDNNKIHFLDSLVKEENHTS